MNNCRPHRLVLVSVSLGLNPDRIVIKHGIQPPCQKPLKALPVVTFEDERHYMWATGRNLRDCFRTVNEEFLAAAKHLTANGLRNVEWWGVSDKTPRAPRPKMSADEELVKIEGVQTTPVEKMSELQKNLDLIGSVGNRGRMEEMGHFNQSV